jgi:hypothetical protein
VRISKYGVNVLGVCGVVDKSRNRDGRGGNLRSSILISVFAKDKCPFANTNVAHTATINKRTCTSPAHTDKHLNPVFSMNARSARVKRHTIHPSISESRSETARVYLLFLSSIVLSLIEVVAISRLFRSKTRQIWNRLGQALLNPLQPCTHTHAM